MVECMRDVLMHLSEVRERLSRQNRVLLLLDFDGTLCPLAASPEKACLPKVVHEMLQRLTLRPRIIVAVLSGRPLVYLKSVFGVPSLFFGGNHGIEMEGPSYSFCHPGAKTLKVLIQELAQQFETPVSEVPGALLENKEFSLAIHCRNVAPAQRLSFDTLVTRLREQTTGQPVRWRRGKEVWELLPHVAWDKGRAAEALIRHLGDPFPVAVGDDATDEDMFMALSNSAITIRVGTNCDSFAQFCLKRQGEVIRFLRFLEQELN
jgi:trehalose 6-phosphate phosphatase